MSSASRIGRRQQERLFKLMESHPMLARATVNLGKGSNNRIRSKWNELAEILNATGDGAAKTGQQWKRYWINLKSRVKARAEMKRQEQEATGGDQNIESELTEHEERILTIVGHNAVNGDEELVRSSFVPRSTEDAFSASPVLPRTSTTPPPFQTLQLPSTPLQCNIPSTPGFKFDPVEPPVPEPDNWQDPYDEPPAWYTALERARIEASRENTKLIVNAIDRLTAVIQAKNI